MVQGHLLAKQGHFLLLNLRICADEPRQVHETFHPFNDQFVYENDPSSHTHRQVQGIEL